MRQRFTVWFFVAVWTSAVDAQTIIGHVVDSAGKPVESAEVHIWRKGRDVNGGNQNRVWNQSSSRPTTEQADLAWRDRELSMPICYRLALADASAARRIADSLRDVAARTSARAAVAQALAERDLAAARRLARETVVALPPVGSAGVRFDYAATEAAAICQWLPVLERVDADLGREFLWRAVSLRPLRPIDDQLDDEVEQAELHLIGLLARYERCFAATLLAPLASRANELSQTEFSNVALVFAAAGLTDPRASVVLLDRLPPGKEGVGRGSHGWAHALWAGAVAAPSEHTNYEGRYRDPSRYESW